MLIPDETGKFEADGYIYPECLLKQSIHLLEERSEIQIPEDLPTLVEQGYSPEAAPPEELDLWIDHLMEDQVKAAAGGGYLINAPEKGYTPIKEAERIQFDDLESSSYLSAKTRLGEPTVRIVLLPPERFGSLRSKSQHCGDRLCLSDVTREEAREILKASIGIIEHSYCGNNDVWGFPAIAIRRTKIPKGTRICQFQLVKQAEPIEFEQVDDLGNPDRGGWGSTGKS